MASIVSILLTVQFLTPQFTIAEIKKTFIIDIVLAVFIVVQTLFPLACIRLSLLPALLLHMHLL